MKKYIVIIPTLIVIYFLTLTIESKDIKPKNVDNENQETLVSVFYENNNYELKLNDYVINVLACEMPASFNIEALKAGAVAIRTFYLYKKNTNPYYIASSSDQCYINEDKMRIKWNDTYDKYYNIIKTAVDETKDEVIYYNGNLIESFYFSMSNGYTENLENVFNEARPYLVSVESLWDKNVNNFEKSVEITKEDFFNKLGLEINDTINFEIDSRTSSNRIEKIKINGKIFKGTEFRKLLGIRSTDFDITIDNNILITTRGYGHGVGLSQYGANEMAKLGYNYKEILKHYYTGVEILKLNV